MATSPSSVNLIALPTRLSSTWVKRRSSPRPRGRSADLGRELEFLVGRQRFDRAVDCLGNVLQGVIGEVEHELARFDLGQIEHIIDQPQQVLAVALKPLQHPHHPLRWLAIGAIGHQLGVAQDGIQWGAQLVAHIGEELRFVLTRLLKLSAFFFDFME